MAFCQQCGTELAGSGQFCGSCGASTGTQASSTTPQATTPTPWQSGAPAATVPRPKSTRGLGVALQWLLGISSVLFAVNAVVALTSYGTVKDIESGQISGFQAAVEAEDVEALMSAMFGFNIFLGLPVFVLLIIWTHRGYKNLASFGVRNYRLGTGMAIGAWFIPFYNMIGPKQIINDIWRASEPGRPIDNGWTKRGIRPIFSMWWIGYFITISMASVGNNMMTGDTPQDPLLGSKILRDPAEAASGLALQSMGLIGLTVVAILGLITIRQITTRHMTRIAELANPPRTHTAQTPSTTSPNSSPPQTTPQPDLPSPRSADTDSSASNAETPPSDEDAQSRPLERKDRRDGF